MAWYRYIKCGVCMRMLTVTWCSLHPKACQHFCYTKRVYFIWHSRKWIGTQHVLSQLHVSIGIHQQNKMCSSILFMYLTSNAFTDGMMPDISVVIALPLLQPWGLLSLSKANMYVLCHEASVCVMCACLSVSAVFSPRLCEMWTLCDSFFPAWHSVVLLSYISHRCLKTGFRLKSFAALFLSQLWMKTLNRTWLFALSVKGQACYYSIQTPLLPKKYRFGF